MRAYLAHAKVETKLALTQSESLLVNLGIPVLALVAFSLIKVLPLPKGSKEPTTFLVPGTIALAIMATGMVAQGISTAVDRTYGVLKRLGSTPLGKGGLIAAKITAIAVVEVLQVIVLMAVGLALGWHPRGSGIAFVASLILATSAFTGIGLLLAGILRSEVMIGLANAVYLVLLFLGGMIFPLSSLPTVLFDLANLLPAAATSQIFYHSLGIGGSISASKWIVLVAWAVLAPLAATRFFRWE